MTIFKCFNSWNNIVLRRLLRGKGASSNAQILMIKSIRLKEVKGFTLKSHEQLHQSLQKELSCKQTLGKNICKRVNIKILHRLLVPVFLGKPRSFSFSSLLWNMCPLLTINILKWALNKATGDWNSSLDICPPRIQLSYCIDHSWIFRPPSTRLCKIPALYLKFCSPSPLI